MIDIFCFYRLGKKSLLVLITRACHRGRIKTIDAPLEVHPIEEIKGFPTVVEFYV